MTKSEFHIAFKLELDKTNSLSYPSFLPEEIDYWINRAISLFVKTRAFGTNPKSIGFQEDQKRSDDLRTCLNIGYYAPTSINGNMYIFDIPTDYWFMMGESAIISYTWNGVLCTKEVPFTEATIETYKAKMYDTLNDFNMNYDYAEPIRFYSNNKIYVLTDGNYSISTIDLIYITKPTVFDITDTNITEYTYLPEHTHEEVVRLAVSLALENISDSRIQTYSGVVASME